MTPDVAAGPMTASGESRQVTVAKAALCEAGHPDLAALVRTNRIGAPTIANDEAHRCHRPVIARAFVLGHQAAGHPAHLGRGINSAFEWVDTVECPCPEWATTSRGEAR